MCRLTVHSSAFDLPEPDAPTSSPCRPRLAAEPKRHLAATRIKTEQEPTLLDKRRAAGTPRRKHITDTDRLARAPARVAARLAVAPL
jgi:hypothetical protein